MAKRPYNRKCTSMLSVRLQDELIEKLKKNTSLSVAEQIRRALELYLNR